MVWGVGVVSGSGARSYIFGLCVVQELRSRIPRNSDGSLAMAWLVPAGMVSGIAAQILTYPGDTIRKLMIVNGVGGSPRAYSNTWVREVQDSSLERHIEGCVCGKARFCWVLGVNRTAVGLCGPLKA